MLADLTGKTALVTGGGRGVGRATALVLARQGADVALGDIDKEAASNVTTEIQAIARRAMTVEMDVTSTDSAGTAIGRILGDWGHLDILVNSAAIVGAPGWIQADEVRKEDWDVVLDVNIKGVVNCCEAVMGHMIKRRYGKIINISSNGARPSGRGDGSPAAAALEITLIPYCASKAAVVRYTQSLASIAGQHNINVNAVAPGTMNTEMGLALSELQRTKDPSLSSIDSEELRRKRSAQNTLFGRELLPDDVAKTVAFLASDDARNITGQAIYVDGGAVMV